MEKIHTNNAPKTVGPYSQAIAHGGIVYCSGQIALIPETGELLGGDVQAQTQQVLTNLKQVLLEAGSDLDCVLRTEVFLKDMNDYAAVNEVYAKSFSRDPSPARFAVEVSRLPKDVLVEIACIAHQK